jgi:peptidoglycan/xylan/chitin deacetylase (PgdA/CDA1 family)
MRRTNFPLALLVGLIGFPAGLAPAKAQMPPRPEVQPAAVAGIAAPTVSPLPALATPGSTATPAPSPSPSPSPKPRKHSYNSCEVDGPYVAMTFDDGPHPVLTPRLLDMLRERGIRATFYVIGKNVAAYPEIVQRMAAEGHEVGNHSYNHPAFTKLSPATLAAEIQSTNEAIAAAIPQKPTTVRPPYGATNAAINKRLAEEFGLTVAMWSVDPQDWKYRNAARVSSHIIQNTAPGAIILAHDIHPSTIDAMPATLDALLAKGFKFTTVAELIAMDTPKTAPARTGGPGVPISAPPPAMEPPEAYSPEPPAAATPAPAVQ